MTSTEYKTSAGWYRRRGKRIGDIVIATLISVVMLPVALATALCVRITMGSPVFFRQERAGFEGQSFTLIKFRSMLDQMGPDGGVRSDTGRLTAFGRFIRRTSLDELPELLHVLRGEMSLVGPRPLLPRYNDRYSSEQARRLTVRPGLTGWAQINGRNNTTWNQRLACDVWYVDNLSPFLDLMILVKTIPAVLLGVGVSPEGDAFMPEFIGDVDDSSDTDSVT